MERIRNWVTRRNNNNNSSMDISKELDDENTVTNFVNMGSPSSSSSTTTTTRTICRHSDTPKTPLSEKNNCNITTLFDCDVAFETVARIMLYRYEHEKKTVKEAIFESLLTQQERQSFLQSLDLRIAQFYLDHHHEDGGEISFTKYNDKNYTLIKQTHEVFSKELRILWREHHNVNNNHNDGDTPENVPPNKQPMQLSSSPSTTLQLKNITKSQSRTLSSPHKSINPTPSCVSQKSKFSSPNKNKKKWP